MKKFIVPIVLFCLVSCHTASYMHELDSTPYGIDYREGKWLLNEVNAPATIKERLTKIAFKAFEKELGKRIEKFDNLPNLYAPYLPIKPNNLLLKQFKNDTDFDYVINIESKNSVNDIGPFKIGDTYSDSRNAAYTVMEVYDLNTLEVIYYRKVIGHVTIDEDDNEDFALVKSTNGIMISCLKRILRKIN